MDILSGKKTIAKLLKIVSLMRIIRDVIKIYFLMLLEFLGVFSTEDTVIIRFCTAVYVNLFIKKYLELKIDN